MTQHRCVYQTGTRPDYYDKIQIHPKSKTGERRIPAILNPVDKNAIEAGLQLKERFDGKVDLFPWLLLPQLKS